MARRFTERQRRARRRQRCVHGHEMKRADRHSRPECAECNEPVCRKHTVEGRTDRPGGVFVRCCSKECFDAFAVRWALEHVVSA